MTTINDAVNAYSAISKPIGNDSAQKAGAASEGAPSFGEVLKASIGNAIDAQTKSEQVGAKALVGKADMSEVLAAVNDAEIALNTVLAVRDRVVQAYETVMRTPI